MYIQLSKKKKKKCASFGRFISSYGTELSPLFPYLRASLFKRGGGGVGLDRCTGLCCPTQGFPDLRVDPRSWRVVSLFYEFIYVPSNLPAYQAVVIQQLSIG